MEYLIYLAIGVTAGICSGLFGIGGGVVIVPLLVYFAKFSQHKATGTSLVALLLPVGALAVHAYYKAGKITNQDFIVGLTIAAGLFLGAYAGSKLGLSLSDVTLRRAFAVFVMLVGLRMFFIKS